MLKSLNCLLGPENPEPSADFLNTRLMHPKMDKHPTTTDYTHLC